MASQEASAASPNSTLSREGLSQDGSNPHSGNHLVSSQAGTNLVSTQSGRQAVRCSTRLWPSPTDSGTPRWIARSPWAARLHPRQLGAHLGTGLPREQCYSQGK